MSLKKRRVAKTIPGGLPNRSSGKKSSLKGYGQSAGIWKVAQVGGGGEPFIEARGEQENYRHRRGGTAILGKTWVLGGKDRKLKENFLIKVLQNWGKTILSNCPKSRDSLRGRGSKS